MAKRKLTFEFECDKDITDETVEWDNAKSDNTISIYNGFVEYKG